MRYKLLNAGTVLSNIPAVTVAKHFVPLSVLFWRKINMEA